jgi:hypothetical protein
MLEARADGNSREWLLMLFIENRRQKWNVTLGKYVLTYHTLTVNLSSKGSDNPGQPGRNVSFFLWMFTVGGESYLEMLLKNAVRMEMNPTF